MISNELKAFLASGPTESFDLEMKEWFDPTDTQGRAKLIKACHALRNNDGGTFVIGFDNAGRQVPAQPGFDVKAKFHSDFVQETVSKASSDPFEVIVEFVEVNSIEHPVIQISSGIKTPVICKTDLKQDEKYLLRDNAIYVRSLTSNHRVSSSEIRRNDWERLLTICFENREADVARFVQRHLKEIINPDLLKLAANGQELVVVDAILKSGYQRYVDLCRDNAVKVEQYWATREFAVSIQGARDNTKPLVPNESLVQNISISLPRVTGWSPWVMSAGGKLSPDVVNGELESFIDLHASKVFHAGLDYWSINPNGRLYHLRVVEDDFASEKVKPGEVLDFYLQICRISEGILVAISIAKSLGFNVEDSSLVFAARWQNLCNRKLVSWVDKDRSFSGWKPAIQESYQRDVRIPLNVARTEIFQYVKPIIDHLFAVFGGREIDENVVREIVDKATQHRF